MSALQPYVCQTCASQMPLSQQWRSAACPVEFVAECARCGSTYRILVRLLPTFYAVPQSSHFDWQQALAHELFQAYAKAARREGDLLGLVTSTWEKLSITEKRLWLTTHRFYLGRTAA